MMAHGARPCCVAVAVLVFMVVCVQPAASSSSREAAAALQRVEIVDMYTAQDLQEKPDVTKGAEEEDVSTTGFGAEEEREVPTGPDPIHHHGQGPSRRRQTP